MVYSKNFITLIVLSMVILILTGCNGKENRSAQNSKSGIEIETAVNKSEEAEIQPENLDGITKGKLAADIEVDYSSYFGEIKGTAVFYDGNKNSYYIYNKELADYQSSPCSSFKIISCLMGLESGVIDPSDSVLKWNNTLYPIKDWNQDMDYRQAFKYSSVWYFRRVIDLVSKAYVTDILDKLDYGNQDISHWAGSGINKDSEGNVLPDINGFWLESSLLISPRQQTEVMYKIFVKNQVFREENLELVKETMLIENNRSNIKIYGKTGSGKKDDSWSDAWFVGFFEKGNDKTCFALRLNEPKAKSVNAKETAVKIINGEFGD